MGGTLTNFQTIQKRIDRLKQLEKWEEDGTFEVLPKKEVIILRKEKDRLQKFLGGIKGMKGLPSALFIIDPRKERIAVAEARKLGIPIVGIVDTTAIRMKSTTLSQVTTTRSALLNCLLLKWQTLS